MRTDSPHPLHDSLDLGQRPTAEGDPLPTGTRPAVHGSEAPNRPSHANAYNARTHTHTRAPTHARAHNHNNGGVTRRPGCLGAGGAGGQNSTARPMSSLPARAFHVALTPQGPVLSFDAARTQRPRRSSSQSAEPRRPCTRPRALLRRSHAAPTQEQLPISGA